MLYLYHILATELKSFYHPPRCSQYSDVDKCDSNWIQGKVLYWGASNEMIEQSKEQFTNQGPVRSSREKTRPLLPQFLHHHHLRKDLTNTCWAGGIKLGDQEDSTEMQHLSWVSNNGWNIDSRQKMKEKMFLAGWPAGVEMGSQVNNRPAEKRRMLTVILIKKWVRSTESTLQCVTRITQFNMFWRFSGPRVGILCQVHLSQQWCTESHLLAEVSCVYLLLAAQHSRCGPLVKRPCPTLSLHWGPAGGSCSEAPKLIPENWLITFASPLCVAHSLTGWGRAQGLCKAGPGSPQFNSAFSFSETMFIWSSCWRIQIQRRNRKHLEDHNSLT